MSAQALIQDLTSDGLSLSVADGDRIAVDGPRDALDKWLPEIRAHKADLIACLIQAANDAPDTPRRLWLITPPDGQRFSLSRSPAGTLAEIARDYPDCTITPELDDQTPAPPLHPDALAVVYAYLRHIGETDLVVGQAFIDGLARDPAQLRACFETVVRLGLADWDETATEQGSGLDPDPSPKRFCACCRHWQADSINPPGGLGQCRIDAPRSRKAGSCWPWTHAGAEIDCNQFEDSTHE